jgi:16S rRNA (uracil1498-N3)-methyltransferase
MPRFYCPHPSLAASTPAELSDTVVTLDDDQAHHARRVLRLTDGDAVDIFDGQGVVARGVVEHRGKQSDIRITRAARVSRPGPWIGIAVATPKGPRAVEMVNQLSQLGADSYTPLICDRSVVRPGSTRLEQFRRVCIESAKQCGRPYLMRVEPLATLASVMSDPHGLCLITRPAVEDETGSDETTSQALPPMPVDLTAEAEAIVILIGPEGGWTPNELQAAQQAGCQPWTLSHHVLRVETAAAAAVALIRYLSHPPTLRL